MSAAAKVAIIGAGIGREHLNAYRQLQEQFTVSAICELDIARAEAIIGDDNISTISDFATILRDASIDIIDICLPPHLHFCAVTDALRAGKHVVCEKPLVTSLRQVDEIIDLCTQTGRVVFPVFQYRFGKAMSQLQALVDANLAGKPYVASLETHWNRGTDYYSIPWRGTWKGEQGGAVLGHAIHNHDFLTQIMGPVKELSAFTTTRVNAIETEDCAAITFKMENGTLATSSITLGAAGNTSRLRFCFEHLSATSGTTPYAPATDTWTFTARDPATQSDIDKVVKSVQEPSSGFTGFFEQIALSLAGKPNKAVSLESARQSIELVSAIYQSVQTDQHVSLPLSKNDLNYDGWITKTALNS